MVVQETLQIGVKRREMESKEDKERYSHLNAVFQRIARRDMKTFYKPPSAGNMH